MLFDFNIILRLYEIVNCLLYLSYYCRQYYYCCLCCHHFNTFYVLILFLLSTIYAHHQSPLYIYFSFLTNLFHWRPFHWLFVDLPSRPNPTTHSSSTQSPYTAFVSIVSTSLSTTNNLLTDIPTLFHNMPITSKIAAIYTNLN